MFRRCSEAKHLCGYKPAHTHSQCSVIAEIIRIIMKRAYTTRPSSWLEHRDKKHSMRLLERVFDWREQQFHSGYELMAKRGTGRWLNMKHYVCFRVFEKSFWPFHGGTIFFPYHRTEQKVRLNTDKRLMLVIGRHPNTESVFHSWAATFASLVCEPLNDEQTLPLTTVKWKERH